MGFQLIRRQPFVNFLQLKQNTQLYKQDCLTEDDVLLKKLEEIFRNTSKRGELVDDLICTGGRNTHDLVLKARFLEVLNEYEQIKNSKEKKLAGKKIVQVFFSSPSSLFYIPNLPRTYEKQLQRFNFEAFSNVKILFMKDLVQSQVVKKLLL